MTFLSSVSPSERIEEEIIAYMKEHWDNGNKHMGSLKRAFCNAHPEYRYASNSMRQKIFRAAKDCYIKINAETNGKVVIPRLNSKHTFPIYKALNELVNEGKITKETPNLGEKVKQLIKEKFPEWSHIEFTQSQVSNMVNCWRKKPFKEKSLDHESIVAFPPSPPLSPNSPSSEEDKDTGISSSNPISPSFPKSSLNIFSPSPPLSPSSSSSEEDKDTEISSSNPISPSFPKSSLNIFSPSPPLSPSSSSSEEDKDTEISASKKMNQALKKKMMACMQKHWNHGIRDKKSLKKHFYAAYPAYDEPTMRQKVSRAAALCYAKIYAETSGKVIFPKLDSKYTVPIYEALNELVNEGKITRETPHLRETTHLTETVKQLIRKKFPEWSHIVFTPTQLNNIVDSWKRRRSFSIGDHEAIIALSTLADAPSFQKLK